MTPAALQVDAVEVALGRARRIGPVSFAAEQGDVVVLTGGAGSGKSTLLEVVTGARQPTVGRVTLHGEPPRVREAGILTQRHELLGGLTAVENVAVRVLGRPAGAPGLGTARSPRPHVVVAEIEALLASLALPPASWHNLAEQLSGGQQQRVALARALVGAPAFIALDDPASELDEATADVVWSVIRQAAAGGALVVVATDEAHLVERATSVVSLTPG